MDEEKNVTAVILMEEELKEVYIGLKNILKEFIDMKDENYEIVALWIMGTWIHNKFFTYPYLFINAMKGSGKTRLLKLIKELSWEGDMLASLSEAVLFRTTGTLCIDEFEGIGGKDKNALRELLNTAYKKGGKVKRMRKKKSILGEEQVVEEFSTFRPIVMANIWGMEEVLGDRCISIILEKSNNPHTVRKIENFEIDPKIQEIKEKLQVSVVRCSVVTSQNIYIDWNNYINTITTSNDTIHHYTSNDTKQHLLFNKLYESNIDGRNLELTFPLLLVAESIGVFEPTMEILKKTVDERKEDDMMESKDIMLFDFVSQQLPQVFFKIKELTNKFKELIHYDEDEERWLNTKWMGKALRRLNLVTAKKRVGEGREVMLNTSKAAEKIRMFGSSRDEKDITIPK